MGIIHYFYIRGINMRYIRYAIATVFFGFIGQGTSFAADGSSGCGPGWYIFKQNSIVSSSLRATTNGWLSPVVTLGMTFGTSNCAKHNLVLNEKRGLHFVTHNTHNLAAESAQGRGESLGALATAMGCDWRAQESFNNALKSQYDSIYGIRNDDAAVVYERIIDAVGSNAEIAGRCAIAHI
jgi:hypothetical protein